MSDRNGHEIRNLLIDAVLIGGILRVSKRYPKQLFAVELVLLGVWNWYGLSYGYNWEYLVLLATVLYITVCLKHFNMRSPDRGMQAVRNNSIRGQQILLEYNKAGALVCPNCKCRVFPSANCF